MREKFVISHSLKHIYTEAKKQRGITVNTGLSYFIINVYRDALVLLFS